MPILNHVKKLFLCFLFAVSLGVPAVVSALELEPGGHYRSLADAIQFDINNLPTDSPPQEVVDQFDEDFAPVLGGQIDFGFRSNTVWLHLPLENVDNKSRDWILALNTRFMNELRVYLRTDGPWQLMLSNDERSSFSERLLAYRLLAVPFSLEPSETGELLIGYRSRGTTYLPLAIETPQSFADGRILANTKSGGFYTAALLMFLYGLFQLFLPGNRIYLHYTLYLAAAVLYVFHMDGLSFQYLWPDLPGWNAFAALFLGLLINIMAANFSRRFLETWRIAPRFDAAIRAMIWLSVLLIALGLVVEDRYVKLLSFWLTSGGALLYLGAGIYALHLGHRSARFYVVGWAGICSASLISSVIHSLPGAIPVSLSFDITKAGILFDALMFGMAMADRANELRRQRDEAVNREMVALSERAQARWELAASERGREDAVRMAQETNMQLAAASHDIRQPLSSLKLALAGMKEPVFGKDTGVALESVEYLEALVSSYLDTSQETLSATDSQSVHENFPIQLVLDGVTQMFTAEAREHDVALRAVSSSLLVRGNPIATVRIVSNLVKNAIKHTHTGKVLLGCRRVPGGCILCVCDSGRGMNRDELDLALGAFAQVQEDSEGHGLGLHIVATECQKNGYGFDIESEPGRGTVARIHISLAT